jgi:TPR repeat protein
VAPTPQSAAPALNPPAPKQNPAESNALAAQPLNRPPASPRIVPVAARPTAISTEQGGAQEYETAEKYMNNNPRVPRDNREAAEWLWKAVAKGNLAASLALSDLYLRGDGVPKNCDQARLLLDAAAKKGKAAAAERLRNLQAFGCS